MKPAGRLQAAIEILAEIKTRHRPASQALSDWGRGHRFAGSGDRAAIGNIVYDALRHRASIAWRMGSAEARALALGVMVFHWDESAESLGEMFARDPHAPETLSEEEVKALETGTLEGAPGWVQGDIPEWLEEAFEGNFSEDYIAEGQALALRPPTDFRINTLKADRGKVMKALKRFNPEPMELSPIGLRIAPSAGPARTANLQPEAAYQKGWVEVQDQGSQVCSLLVYARPGEQVLDYCAGAGGKTLAMAAAMENKGQIFAYDADRNRLKPIYERLKRAGTRNVQVRSPGESLEDLTGKMDRVVVDAPCTGSGVWRRRPDAKWRLTPDALEKRLAEQAQVLEEASGYVRPGGYLCYITCSVLAQENEGQVSGFLETHEDFELLSAGEVWEELFQGADAKPWSSDDCTITLTPASTGTDGFFFAVMGRRTGEGTPPLPTQASSGNTRP
ncbi:ribosomal RNA small subunit methyltransferase B [bacterium BMS3Bbin10]|nr:ribosomal RNA small subunit methyltransferase B [bacterium BMS3Bbin10]